MWLLWARQVGFCLVVSFCQTDKISGRNRDTGLRVADFAVLAGVG